MNQAAEYLRGFPKKKNHVVTLLSLIQEQQEQQGKEQNICAGMRQQYFSIPTSALDTAPQERKKEEEKCNVK
jgi:hypothetical protein